MDKNFALSMNSDKDLVLSYQVGEKRFFEIYKIKVSNIEYQCKLTLKSSVSSFMTLNSEQSAIVVLDGANDDKVLVFDSDQDSLKNLWYQPVNLTDGSLLNIESQPRSEEFAILSLSHSTMKTNSDVDMLANMVDHYVGGLTVPSDQGLY
jgi:hypothetical protein